MIKINTSNVLILFALVINSAISWLPPRIQQALQSVCGGAYCEDGPIGTFIGYWKWITSSIQLDDSTGEYQRTLGTFSNVFSLTKATSSPESLYQTVRLISILIDLWKWLLCASVCLRMVAINFSALWKNTMDNMDRLWEITRKRKKTSLPWCHWNNPRPLSHSILSSHLLIFYECSAQMGRHLDVKTLCFMFSSNGKIWASTLSCFARLGKRSWQVGKTFDDFVRSIFHRISTAKA